MDSVKDILVSMVNAASPEAALAIAEQHLKGAKLAEAEQICSTYTQGKVPARQARVMAVCIGDGQTSVVMQRMEGTERVAFLDRYAKRILALIAAA